MHKDFLCGYIWKRQRGENSSMKMQNIARPYPVHQLTLCGSIPGDRDTDSLEDLLKGQSDENGYFDIKDEKNRSIGWISCRVLQTLEKQTKNMYYPVMLENIEEGIILIDRQGTVVYANQAYSNLLGIPLWKIIGKNIDRIEPNSILRQVLNVKKPIRRKKHHVQSLNRYADISVFPLLRYGKLQGAYSIFSDVTELNKLKDDVIRAERVSDIYKEQLDFQNIYNETDILTADPDFQKMIQRAEIAARSDASILIRGENGTGKELMAKLIQKCSGRKDKPFITINCAAIPEALLESELFGYEDGTFTGARKGGKIGKFQAASGGTLFLDEIGDMPLSMQAKLLRALQEGQIEKLGSSKVTKVDVRIIAATNLPLEKMIRDKQFRQDLFYRLSVVPLTIPALRDRPGDIGLLANHFLKVENKKLGKDLTLSREVVDRLTRWSWPGNVRELQNMISFMAILCTDEKITLRDLPEQIWSSGTSGTEYKAEPPVWNGRLSLKEALAEYECSMMKAALTESATKSEAIRKLGISRKSFYEKLRLYGIE